MAQLLFGHVAVASAEALQDRLEPLVRSTGVGGPALALELCCFGALSADWEGMTARLVRSCQGKVEAAARAQQGADHKRSTRLPLHFKGAPSSVLSGSAAAALPQQEAAHPSKRSGRSADAGEQLPVKKPRLSTDMAEQQLPVQASSYAGAAERLAERIMSGRCAEPFCSALGRERQAGGSQGAALAAHPALVSEVARTSFPVCQAYLSALLRAAAGSEHVEEALTGLVHLLRLEGLPRRLTEAALLRHCTMI